MNQLSSSQLEKFSLISFLTYFLLSFFPSSFLPLFSSKVSDSDPLGADLASEGVMADRSRLEPKQKSLEDSFDSPAHQNGSEKSASENGGASLDEAESNGVAMETSPTEKGFCKNGHASRFLERQVPHLRANTPKR